MYNLHNIQSTVQQTAEAIAEVLKIEVEIADDKLMRVAGTGQCADNCGQMMDEGFVYRHVLTSGEAIVIDHPGFHPLCEPCRYYQNCSEKAEVAMPIKVDERIIGIIGLICFDAKQGKRLMNQTDSLLRFLGKMAELVAGKIVENDQKRQQEVVMNELMTILNLLHDGILVVNDEQFVKNMNKSALKMLTISEKIPFQLDHVIDGQRIWKAIQKNGCFSGQIKQKQGHGQLFCDAVAIKTLGNLEGAVIMLKDSQQVQKLVKEATVTGITTDFPQIIGESPKMQELKEVAQRVAPSSATLIIEGASGTGKELFARAIHQSSNRKNYAFIAINCGAIPENLLESELFGYEEGSFTGAQRGGKLGKFELAHKGTIFLDEIGDMPLHLQVKLLRVLQERCVERIGGSRPIPIDVRVIAATHQNLEKLVVTGEFREDLYYRLHVIPLMIPPLCERKDDIPLLAKSFLNHYCQLLGKAVLSMTPDVYDRLKKYTWPGNVRELGNVIEYVSTMAVGDVVTVAMLPRRICNPMPLHNKIQSLKIVDLEREAITKALAIASEMGHKDEAAKLLGISRATLYRKIKEYHVVEIKKFD
jgi:sigma-54 dependent transcriptional regulator, acetoin dehydrogenase operon transcriptional activator AcoR